jgi:predicted TIM-barrel fold metal-dependent hydrolase
MKNIIDPHVHLFDLEQGAYDWLKPDFAPEWSDKKAIYNSYNDSDLQQQTSFSVTGYVHIEAGFDNKKGHSELINIEQRASLPHRSIGFIDITLEPTQFMTELSKQLLQHSFVGIRHILEPIEIIDETLEVYEQDAGKPQEGRITTLLENANSFINLSVLSIHKGIFELQCDVNNRELVVQIFSFFQRLPKLQLVLNHAGFAPTAFDVDGQLNAAFNDWKINVRLLAQLPNIYVKCSGYEMIKRGYDKAQMQAVLIHCIDVFGAANVMLASNFPLCQFSLSYEDYWQQSFAVLDQMIEQRVLDTKHKKALYFDNAFRIYQFS